MTNINVLEFIPVLIAMIRLAKSWSNRHVVLHSDNTQVLAGINK